MADTEKVTINMSVVDLGQVDLLVNEGFYSSRTDFIRTAIRNQLQSHTDGVKQILTRKSMALGAVGYNQRELESFQRKGEQLEIRVVGVLVLEGDVQPETALAVIKNIQVFGVFHASDPVKTALAGRIL